MQVKKPYPRIEVQGNYAAEMFGNFYRVQVMKLNKKRDGAYCFFVDVGTEEWLPINVIYHCNKNFLDIPPLAICLRLIGLEYFSKSPCSQRWMETYLIGKTLTAMIKSSEYEYTNINIPVALKKFTNIRAVLYETDENGQQTNLNDMILTKFALLRQQQHWSTSSWSM